MSESSFKSMSSDLTQPYRQPYRSPKNWMELNMIHPPHQMFEKAPYQCNSNHTSINSAHMPPPPTSTTAIRHQYHNDHNYYNPSPSVVHPQYIDVPVESERLPLKKRRCVVPPTLSNAMVPSVEHVSSSTTLSTTTAATATVQNNNTQTACNYTENRYRPFNDNWSIMYARLVRYYEEHGHCRVPTCYKQDPSLASWLKNQRNREHTLTEERKQRLAKIGFYKLRNATPQERTKAAHKSLQVGFDKRWEVMLKRLAAYKKEHGHCNVPNVYKADPKLASWVRNQRSKQKEIPAERKERMEKVGFLWNGHRETSNQKWMAMFQSLEKYAQSTGNCRISEAEFPKLRKWVYRQRADRHNLSQDRIQRLNSIGFTWSGR